MLATLDALFAAGGRPGSFLGIGDVSVTADGAAVIVVVVSTCWKHTLNMLSHVHALVKPLLVACLHAFWDVMKVHLTGSVPPGLWVVVDRSGPNVAGSVVF